MPRRSCLLLIQIGLSIRNHKDAIKDGQRAVALNSTFTDGYEYIIKNCLQIGDVDGAEKAIKKLTEIGSNPDITNGYERELTALKLFVQMATQCYEQNEFQEAGMYQEISTFLVRII